MLLRPEQHRVPVLKDRADQLLELEGKLHVTGLLYHPQVRKLLKTAYKCRKQRIFDSVVFRLELAIKNYGIIAMRYPDPFRPYCPAELCHQGSLYLMNQMDGQAIYIDPNMFLTGLGILGPQQAGKSRMFVQLINEFRRIHPDVRITVIDPKGNFSKLSGFWHINSENTSLDLTPSATITLEDFCFELMPILADSAGLIYGLTILYEALEIVCKQRQEYIQKTGLDPGICLQDILYAISSMKTSGIRKTGYRDAAETAMNLIIGISKLFCCRQGISLDWLFSHNVVINARSLTNDTQCRFFATFLLYWLYQRARFSPETNAVKHIIIIDDASRFIGCTGTQFDGNSRTSPLGHILAVLRSSGVCLIYATQLPAQIDSAVLASTSNILTVGSINGVENLKVIQGKMSLTDERVSEIPRFKKRQMLAYIAGSDWPHPIHGFTPDVDLDRYTTDTPIRPLIEIKRWCPLTEIPEHLLLNRVVCAPIEPSPFAPEESAKDAPAIPVLKGLLEHILRDCVANPFDIVGVRAKRLDMSVRVYESHKDSLVQMGYLQPSSCGNAIYLIATKMAYEELGFTDPYKRSTSIEHSFYVNLAAYYLKQSGWKVQVEVSIGNRGQTIDVVAMDKSGIMHAYEITLNTSNLIDNAAKLQDTAYQTITWLCRDGDTAKATKAYFNKSVSLPTELTNKFEYAFFSKWIKTMRKRRM
jgi:hypothetical protein